MDPTQDRSAQWGVEKLKAAFEGREAIYVEGCIARVRVTDIGRELLLTATVSMIPTPGLPVPRGCWGGASSVRSWRISGGSMARISAARWQMGYGGWTLYFDQAVIDSVLSIAAAHAAPDQEGACDKALTDFFWTRVFGIPPRSELEPPPP